MTIWNYTDCHSHKACTQMWNDMLKIEGTTHWGACNVSKGTLQLQVPSWATSTSGGEVQMHANAAQPLTKDCHHMERRLFNGSCP